jgi:hypothetical protein
MGIATSTAEREMLVKLSRQQVSTGKNWALSLRSRSCPCWSVRFP